MAPVPRVLASHASRIGIGLARDSPVPLAHPEVSMLDLLPRWMILAAAFAGTATSPGSGSGAFEVTSTR